MRDSWRGPGGVQNNISRRPCCSPTPCGSEDSTICLESSDPRGVGLQNQELLFCTPGVISSENAALAEIPTKAIDKKQQAHPDRNGDFKNMATGSRLEKADWFRIGKLIAGVGYAHFDPDPHPALKNRNLEFRASEFNDGSMNGDLSISSKTISEPSWSSRTAGMGTTLRRTDFT